MGAPTIVGLGEGLEDLLASRLDGADRLRTIPVSSRLDRDLGRTVCVRARDEGEVEPLGNVENSVSIPPTLFQTLW